MAISFNNSKRLTWAALLMCNAQVFGLMFMTAADVAQHVAAVLTVAIPFQLGLVAAWTGITNMAETKWQAKA